MGDDRVCCQSNTTKYHQCMLCMDLVGSETLLLQEWMSSYDPDILNMMVTDEPDSKIEKLIDSCSKMKCAVPLSFFAGMFFVGMVFCVLKTGCPGVMSEWITNSKIYKYPTLFG